MNTKIHQILKQEFPSLEVKASHDEISKADLETPYTKEVYTFIMDVYAYPNSVKTFVKEDSSIWISIPEAFDRELVS